MNQKDSGLSQKGAIGGCTAVIVLVALALIRFLNGGAKQAPLLPPGPQRPAPGLFHDEDPLAGLPHNPGASNQVAEVIKQSVESTRQYDPTEEEDGLSAFRRHFSVIGATVVGQAASGLESGGLSVVTALLASTTLKIRPRQVPIPLARRNNPWIKRLSPQEGAASLTHYRKLGAAIGDLQRDVAQMTDPTKATKREDKQAVLAQLHKALERGQGSLRALNSEQCDERAAHLTKKVSEILRLLESTVSSQLLLLKLIDDARGTGKASIREETRTETFRSLAESIQTVNRTVAELWGSESRIRRAYQEWLMDRYGIDTSNDDSKGAAAPQDK